MIITEIKKVGKGRRYKVYIDGNLEGSFEAEILAKFKFKTGQEVEREVLDEAKLANSDLTCFDTALSTLEGGMKTEKMLRDALKRKGFFPSSIKKAMEKIKDYGYLDDGAFADAFISTYSSSKGKRKLKMELIAKGVPAEIVEEKLENIEDEEQEQTCQALAEKFMKNRELNDKNLQKLYRHLLSKGFDYSVVSRVAKGVKDDWN